MMKVFLDTNVLLDYVLGREFGDDAAQLLQRGLNGAFSLQASFLTFANMAYILKGKADIYDLLANLNHFVTVLPNNNAQIIEALSQRVHDFEDMLQYQCAIEGGCDVIITNNRKDFMEFCNLPIMTAAQFLVKYDS